MRGLPPSYFASLLLPSAFPFLCKSNSRAITIIARLIAKKYLKTTSYHQSAKKGNGQRVAIMLLAPA
jgi:hypothetical protein